MERFRACVEVVPRIPLGSDKAAAIALSAERNPFGPGLIESTWIADLACSTACRARALRPVLLL